MKKSLIISFFILILSAISHAQDARMEAVGFLGGENLYYLYTSIGLLADSYYGGIYGADFAKQMTGYMTISAMKSKETFRKISEGGTLSPGDRELASSIMDCYDMLVNEADAFQSSLEVTNKQTRDTFKIYKGKAWAKIRLIWKSPD
ncbi:MAG: hypothetical protein ABSG94_02590 [Brevinematales bacterium]|jgi:hypothetical protein